MSENSNTTMLLIDDEIDLQQLVKIALKSKGYIAEITVVVNKISKKEGIDCFVQYSNLQQLINATNEILKI